METVDLGRVIFFSRGTSVQFSHSVMSNSVTPMDCSIPGFPVHHQLLELAQTHVPQVSDNHPTISSSVDPFSSCLQSFPASESFLISQFFASGGQSLGASASASVLPMNIQWIMRCLDDPRRRQWHPTPVLLPRKSHGQRSLVGCSPWGRYSRIRLHFHFHFSLLCIGEGNGNPFQCFCLENPRDGGAWWAAAYGIAQSRTRLKRLSSSSSSYPVQSQFTHEQSLLL